MAVLVVVALALLVMALGAVVVAALQVRGTLLATIAAAGRAAERVRPLTEELESELAVTSTEVEAVGERLRAHAASRARGRGRGRRAGR